MPTLTSEHRILFFQQMEMLLSSGVLVADALSSLKDRFPDDRTRRVLREVHAQVAESRTGLSQALARFPRSFPPGVVAVIEAGEHGGSALLAARFGDLAERLAYEEAHRRQVRRACAYPAFVICMAAGLLLLLLAVVFPRLAELLSSLGDQLPPLTRGIIAVAAFVRTAWLPITLVPAVSPFVVLGLRRIPSVGRRLDRWFLRLPLIGAIYQDATVALFCKIYRSLYLANQPAPATIDLCIKVVANEAFRDGLRSARHQITHHGVTLSVALSRSGLFPPLACLAIEVGEQSCRIASALERVSVYFSARARERTDAAIAVINPALTLAVVGGAAVILISFFQAAYQVVYAVH